MGALLWIIMDYGRKYELWVADHVLSSEELFCICLRIVLSFTDSGPVTQWTDSHSEEGLEMLDTGLL